MLACIEEINEDHVVVDNCSIALRSDQYDELAKKKIPYDELIEWELVRHAESGNT